MGVKNKFQELKKKKWIYLSFLVTFSTVDLVNFPSEHEAKTEFLFDTRKWYFDNKVEKEEFGRHLKGIR